MTHADLPDKVMANLLQTPEADETILTRWSHCALTDSPAATLGRGLAGDLPAPEVNARTVLRYGEAQPADYLVVGRLGEGGMGIVFEAEQVYFHRRVALKMIKPALASDPTAVKAFFREAVITSRLDHPGIIPVLDFGVSQDGRALYAMMKAGGVPWHRVMRKKTLSENLAIFDRVADIVAYAHGRGILHRDIKPANVLLGNHGEVWLGDWGIALARLPDGTYSHAGPAGTPQYMAPEMARCDAMNIGTACDIYLLGAVLFEIITGSPPHDGENARAALLNSARNAIHSADQTKGLLQIAYMCMAEEPKHRFGSVGDLQESIAKQLRLDESVCRRQQADAYLASARKTGEYTLFQQAVLGYDEAIALSPENGTARHNRMQALMDYAEKALAKGDVDLAESIAAQLTEKHKKVVVLATAIAMKKDKLARRNNEHAWQRLALWAMMALLLAGGAAYYMRSSEGTIHSPEFREAIESGKRFKEIEDNARRGGEIMNLGFLLPPNGFSWNFFDFGPFDIIIPQFNESEAEAENRKREEQKREGAAELRRIQRENRDKIITDLVELLAPVAIACEYTHKFKNDEDVSRVFQILHGLKPRLREKAEEVSIMKENGHLKESDADSIIKNLTSLTAYPERYVRGVE